MFWLKLFLLRSKFLHKIKNKTELIQKRFVRRKLYVSKQQDVLFKIDFKKSRVSDEPGHNMTILCNIL